MCHATRGCTAPREEGLKAMKEAVRRVTILRGEMDVLVAEEGGEHPHCFIICHRRMTR